MMVARLIGWLGISWLSSVCVIWVYAYVFPILVVLLTVFGVFDIPWVLLFYLAVCLYCIWFVCFALLVDFCLCFCEGCLHCWLLCLLLCFEFGGLVVWFWFWAILCLDIWGFVSYGLVVVVYGVLVGFPKLVWFWVTCMIVYCCLLYLVCFPVVLGWIWQVLQLKLIVVDLRCWCYLDLAWFLGWAAYFDTSGVCLHWFLFVSFAARTLCRVCMINMCCGIPLYGSCILWFVI